MARVKGRDVVLEMLDAVAKLEATSALHAEQLEALAKHSIVTTATVTALGSELRLVWRSVGELSKGMDDVSKGMDDVSNRMDHVSKRVETLAVAVGGIADQLGGVSSRVGGLEAEMQTLTEAFVEAAVTARTAQQQTGRLAKLLGEFAEGSSSRFDEIEDRLVKLERKAG